MKGADYDIDKLVSIALEDKEFYEESGGGITLSGGEALLQDVRPFILALKKHGLDVTLETEGQVESSPFSTALLCDHILFDVKSADAKKLASIGIDMDLMMANLKSLAGKDVLIRTPVIPGFNQSEDDIAAIAQLIKRLGFERMQLLPFHQFGEKKYEQLQKPYAYRGKAALSDADLSCLIAAAKKEGVNAF
jgi:pyruvate formate lyase activating enzyme